MAGSIRLDSIAFDRGIDRITYTKGEVSARLPGNSELPPAEIGMHSELDALVKQKSLADHLMESIRPQLSNRSVLIPSEFKAGLSRAAEVFAEAATRIVAEAEEKKRALRGKKESIRPGNAEAKILRRAANELKEARKLVDYKDEKSSELFLG